MLINLIVFDNDIYIHCDIIKTEKATILLDAKLLRKDMELLNNCT